LLYLHSPRVVPCSGNGDKGTLDATIGTDGRCRGGWAPSVEEPGRCRRGPVNTQPLAPAVATRTCERPEAMVADARGVDLSPLSLSLSLHDVHPPTALCTIEFHTQLLSSTLQHSQWLLSAGTCKVDSPVNNTNVYAFRFHTLRYEGQKKSPRLINKPNGKREDRVPFTVVQRWSGRWTHVSVGKRCCS
jgi:hypothetical protein